MTGSVPPVAHEVTWFCPDRPTGGTINESDQPHPDLTEAERVMPLDKAAVIVAEYDRLREQRDAVLARHHSTPVMFVVGDRREERTCCAECEEGTYWPCATAQALGVTE